MKNKIVLSLWITSVLSLSTATAQGFKLKPLSREELAPFCQNQMIWGAHDITEEQCLKVAVPCSKKTVDTASDFSQATQALYQCTFKELNIDFPAPPET